MNKSSDRLSRCASAMLRIARREETASEEMHAFGAPSECWDIIIPGILRDARRVLLSYGFTPQEFIDEVQNRTTHKWAYFSGVTHYAFELLNQDQCPMGRGI